MTFEVRMKMEGGKSVMPFIPQNQFSENMLKLFLDSDSSDVSFDVGGELLPAHRVVLKPCAPTLAELCDKYAK